MNKMYVSGIFFLIYSTAKVHSARITNKVVIQIRSMLTLRRIFLRAKPQKSLSKRLLVGKWNAGLLYL